MHIHKITEIDYSSNFFSSIQTKEIEIASYSFEHEVFSGINYDNSTKIFGINNDYRLGTSIARVNHFVDWDLNFKYYIHSNT